MYQERMPCAHDPAHPGPSLELLLSDAREEDPQRIADRLPCVDVGRLGAKEVILPEWLEAVRIRSGLCIGGLVGEAADTGQERRVRDTAG